MSTSLLTLRTPVRSIPGIGRRTARLLAGAGITTVAKFVALPDLLLEATFGPSLPRLRQRTQDALEQNDTSVRATRTGILNVLSSFLL